MNSNLISDRDYVIYMMDEHILVEHKTSSTYLQMYIFIIIFRDRRQYKISSVTKPNLKE